MSTPMDFDLIITIVNRGFASEVVSAAKEAGAEGGTIINGRGTGVHEQAKLFGITIEPEKEIILTFVDRSKTAGIIAAVTEAVGLDNPGKGVAFVLPVSQAIGICHLQTK